MSAWRNDFAKCKGNIPPKSRDDAKWRDVCVVFTLAGDKWEVGGGGGTGWGAERAHGNCAPPPLLFCTSCLRKVRNLNFEQGCKGQLIPKKSSLSG